MLNAPYPGLSEATWQTGPLRSALGLKYGQAGLEVATDAGTRARLDELLYEATEAVTQTAPNAPTTHEVSWSFGFVAGLRRARGIAFGSGADE